MILLDNPACNPQCRACHYKSLEYGDQLKRKQQWAQKQLRAWSSVLDQILPAPETERQAYRTKTWLRGHVEGADVSFGMFRAVSLEGRWKQEFVSWNTCPLHSPAIQKVTARLCEALRGRDVGFCTRSLFGVWMGEPHLVFVAREMLPESIAGLDWSAILEPPFERVWLHVTSQVGKRVFQNQDFQLVFAADGKGVTAPPIGVFRQTSKSLLIEARQKALGHLLQSDPTLLVDLYCGTGALSLELPPTTGWLGVEIAGEAAVYAQSLGPSERPSARFHQAFAGAIEHRLADPRVLQAIESLASSRGYVLYLNPPRSGMSPQAADRVRELIRRLAPQHIAYLSCSASSLARDLGGLEDAGFGVLRLQPFDFFPQTEHFETLALLSAN